MADGPGRAPGRLTKKICDDRLEGWARAVVENARLTCAWTGREHLRPHETYLVMSNHQSLYDIPVLFYVVGPNIRMVTKKELFRVPVFGGALEAAGFISIDRSDRHRAIRSLDEARALLASGTHVWIAPEGTRSLSGQLLPFKKGAFYLAFEAGLPILPVTLARDARRPRREGRPVDGRRERARDDPREDRPAPLHRARQGRGATT